MTSCSQTLLWLPTAEEDRSYGHRRLPGLPHLHGLRPGTVTASCPLQTVSVKVFAWCSCAFSSGRGGVCSDYAAGGSKRYRNCLLPVFHWLHDQRDCWHRHRRAGRGIFPDLGSWQGMWGVCCCGLVAYEQILLAEANLLYSSRYWAAARWFMKCNFAHVLKMAACPFSSAALHTRGGAEERTAPRTSRVLHSEDASLQWPWGTTGGARLHCFLHCPLWREWPLTGHQARDGFNTLNDMFVD